MDFEKTKCKPNAWSRASFLSKTFFWFITPLLFKGWKDDIKLEDIDDCPDADTSEKIGEAIQKQWDKELEKLKSGKKPTLALAFFRVFGSNLCLISVIPFILMCGLRIIQPIFLSRMIRGIAQLPDSLLELYLFAAATCLMPWTYGLLLQNYFFLAQRLSMKMKIACSRLMYWKALKLSQSALVTTSVGQMVNLFSNDLNKYNMIPTYLPFLFTAPFQLIIATCVLWSYMGIASLVGVIVLLLFVPLQMFTGKIFSKLRMKTARLTDERIRLMTEIIGGMRLIKMYGWEFPFAELVEASRKKEVKQIRSNGFVRSLNKALLFVLIQVTLLVTFVGFVLGLRGDLTPEAVFISMTLFVGVRALSLGVSNAINLGSEAWMSCKRIQKFLLMEEQSFANILLESSSNLNTEQNNCRVVMTDVRTSWNDGGIPTLNNVTLTLKDGDLLAVVGPVGCGKTSLLLTILGEMPILSGKTVVRGRLSYAAQDPWIFAGSIRQNIVFSSDFDDAKYTRVLDICALNQDIKMFPYGDKTIVGERGVKLSGGQKARIGLARAIYLDADIYMLDDPLSAVDVTVAKHLFDQCISGYLKDKICILATHQMQFLNNASQILVLKNNACAGLGTFKDLTDSGIDLGFLLDVQEENQKEQLDVGESATDQLLISDKSSNTITQVPPLTPRAAENGKTPESHKETKVSGSIKQKVFTEYLKAGGGIFIVGMLLLFYFLAQALYHGSDFWLTYWTTDEQLKVKIKSCWGNRTKSFLNETGYYDGAFNQSVMGDAFPHSSSSCYKITHNYTLDVHYVEERLNAEFQLSVYGGLILILLLIALIRNVVLFQMCTLASITLHKKVFRSILRSPIAFFDTNPVGIILNRVSQDIGIIDANLPQILVEVLEVIFIVIGTIVVTSILQPYLLLPTFVLGIIFVYLRRFFLRTARDVKRYEGITRSPIMSLLSTTVDGLTTIRAFQAQRHVQNSFDHHQDQHTAVYFANTAVSYWLSLYIEFLTALFVTIITIAMVVIAKDSSFAAQAGLGVATSLGLLAYLQHGLKQSIDFETHMTAVERVLEYTNLKPEAPLESEPGKSPPENWPTRGHIVYRDVSLRYFHNEEPVLKDINFEIFPGEKIGIVGRTGAGKSSIISTLLRMTEPTGKILIDNINILNIGLHDLRKKVTIIPQDPVLCTGTLRKNLDPFNKYSDGDLWNALEQVFLKQPIQAMSDGLNTKISDGGRNFSVGQRQLICLARAILLQNRIILLDEATANVDMNTDSLIQQTIRDRFGNCTVLTVAHRLQTVMDSDRVMVLDVGKLQEFDEPFNLLQNPSSHLSHMLQMVGPGMAKELQKMAQETHHKNIAKKAAGNGHDTDAPVHTAVVNEHGLKSHINRAYDNSELTHL